ATRDAGRELLNHEPDRLDAVLRATLDAASYRVDPWLTAIADRRLRWLAGRDAKFKLGAYGWVDAPKPYTGPPGGASALRPGPTGTGRATRRAARTVAEGARHLWRSAGGRRRACARQRPRRSRGAGDGGGRRPRTAARNARAQDAPLRHGRRDDRAGGHSGCR